MPKSIEQEIEELERQFAGQTPFVRPARLAPGAQPAAVPPPPGAADPLAEELRSLRADIEGAIRPAPARPQRQLPGGTARPLAGGGQPGPGFIELPPVGRPPTLAEATRITTGNIRRATETFRSLPVDIAVKGTLASQLGRLATTSKAARRFPLTRGLKVTRFAAANAVGDLAGELLLQEAEILLGQRKKLSPLELGLSAGTSFGASFALPVIGRFVARIGKIAPRDFKELAFRKLTQQFKLILPKGIFDPAGGVPSAEMRLGRRFALKTMRILKGEGNRAVRELAEGLGESIGVTAEGFGLPSAMRNAAMLRKATDAGSVISIEPLIDKGLELVSRRTVVGRAVTPFRQAANQVFNVLTDIEKEFAPRGFMVTPAEFNRIAGDLEDAALGTIVKLAGRGQTLAAPLAREAEAKQLFFGLFRTARKLLDSEMDAFSNGAWSANRRLTGKILTNAEALAKRMSDERVVGLVANASQNEGVMGLIRQFDELNNTRFSDEIFELFLSRRLSGGATAQTEPIVGFARSIAPRLVIFTQLAKAMGLAVRPLSAATGAFTSAAARETEKAARLFEKERAALIQKLEPPAEP